MVKRRRDPADARCDTTAQFTNGFVPQIVECSIEKACRDGGQKF